MVEITTRSWQSLLIPELAETAAAVAGDIAAHLRERTDVEAAISVAQQQSAEPHLLTWLPYGLAQGWAGMAVMAGYLDVCFPDGAWDEVGHEYLSLAARGSEGYTYLPPGLWAGLSGLAFATWYLSRSGTRYRKLLTTLDQTLLPAATQLAQHLAAQQHGVSVGTYDLISGVAGVGAYLLIRRDADAPARVLDTVVASLVTLAGESGGLPRWHSPARLLDPYMLQSYPNGNLNCGLAHGIPGPLAVLALAHRAGVVVDGLPEAIDRVAHWLATHYIEDAWGINWPTGIALETPDEATGYSRSAWCYGGPGVARALWLAGDALDDAHYRAMAVSAMEAIYRRPLQERRIDSPTFCHGVAGLLQITLRFAHDTGLPQFHRAVQDLTAQLLALREPDTRLGYRSIEKEGRRVDQPGLLDGAPGVALVLLAAATSTIPTWDRIFLLS